MGMYGMPTMPPMPPQAPSNPTSTTAPTAPPASNPSYPPWGMPMFPYANPYFNPYAQMMGMYRPPSMGTAPTVPTVPTDPKVIYAAQLARMKEMGFLNEEVNLEALKQTNGDVFEAVDKIISMLDK